jgi:hypothetical protein
MAHAVVPQVSAGGRIIGSVVLLAVGHVAAWRCIARRDITVIVIAWPVPVSVPVVTRSDAEPVTGPTLGPSGCRRGTGGERQGSECGNDKFSILLFSLGRRRRFLVEARGTGRVPHRFAAARAKDWSRARQLNAEPRGLVPTVLVPGPGSGHDAAWRSGAMELPPVRRCYRFTPCRGRRSGAVLRPHMVCTSCGIIGVDARPNRSGRDL